MLKPIAAALLLGLAASASRAAPESLPLVLPLRCEGPVALGCAWGTPEPSWTPGPATGQRMLSGPFWLELTFPKPVEWRPFSFSLPMNEDRTGVRVRAGDHVWFNPPSRLEGEQFFDCRLVLPLTPGTILAECRPLTFVDQIPSECVKGEGYTGLLCFAGPLLLPAPGVVGWGWRDSRAQTWG